MNRILQFSVAVLVCACLSAATYAQYSQNFDAFADGTTSFGDGSDYQFNNGSVSTGVQNGALRLTTHSQAEGGNVAFRIPAIADSSLGWTATFDFALSEPSGGNEPADGFSFNYGAIPAFNAASANDFNADKYGGAEEGFGDHPGITGDTVFADPSISFEFDTWRALPGDTEHGYNIASWQGGASTDHAFTNVDIIDNTGADATGTAVLTWDPVNGASMTVSGTGLVNGVAFSNVAIPGFVGDDNYGFAFSARTGGANETLEIDNVVITAAVPEPSSFALAALGLVGAACCALRRRVRRKA